VLKPLSTQIRRSTSKVNLTGWSKSLEVTVGGDGIVSHAGLALLRQHRGDVDG